jgi:hypothetical protein
MIPPAKGAYRTSARYEMDDRRLLLRGGALDGDVWRGTVAVGSRVFCGSGPWTPTEICTVTAGVVVDGEGRYCNEAVPAFAPS